jgi:hypothetical protein
MNDASHHDIFVVDTIEAIAYSSDMMSIRSNLTIQRANISGGTDEARLGRFRWSPPASGPAFFLETP